MEMYKEIQEKPLLSRRTFMRKIFKILIWIGNFCTAPLQGIVIVDHRFICIHYYTYYLLCIIIIDYRIWICFVFTFDNEKNATGKDDDYNYSFIIVVTCDNLKQKLY